VDVVEEGNEWSLVTDEPDGEVEASRFLMALHRSSSILLKAAVVMYIGNLDLKSFSVSVASW
jgi:hypothetical protein